jgi:hypothetical protein
MAVWWYVHFRMILVDLVGWLTEHGITVDRSYLPLIVAAARPHC